MPMINHTYSADYIKDKLDENDRDIEKIISSGKLTTREIALLRGMKLHNLAINKELKLITLEEYHVRYKKWQDDMTTYWRGEGE